MTPPSAGDRLGVTAAMCAAGRVMGDPRLSPDGTTVAFVSGRQGRVGARDRGRRRRPRSGHHHRTCSGAIGHRRSGRLRLDPGRHRPGLRHRGRRSALPTRRRRTGSVDHRRRRHRGRRTRRVPRRDPGGVRGRRPPRRRWPGSTRTARGPSGCRPPPTSASTPPGLADASTVAWHEWDVPAMAWDTSHVAVAAAPRDVAAAGGQPASRCPARRRPQRRRGWRSPSLAIPQTDHTSDSSVMPPGG